MGVLSKSIFDRFWLFGWAFGAPILKPALTIDTEPEERRRQHILPTTDILLVLMVFLGSSSLSDVPFNLCQRITKL